MGMLVVGLLLWAFVHLFKRLAPVRYAALRGSIGEQRVKGLTSLLLMAGFALMIFGYKSATFQPVYTPPTWGVHVNMSLMAISLFLLVSSYGTGFVKARLRHPMLLAAMFWAAAHLFVRGDLASIVLFAGIAAWADAEIMAINIREGTWAGRTQGVVKGDILALAMTVPIYVIIVVLHGYLGPSPLPGR